MLLERQQMSAVMEALPMPALQQQHQRVEDWTTSSFQIEQRCTILL
jgi:hypothetical protein